MNLQRLAMHAWAAALATSLALAGCQWFGADRPGLKRYATEERYPADREDSAPAEMPLDLPTGDADTTAAGEVTLDPTLRPGNPEALGEGARLLAGRDFEPVYFDRDGSELDLAGRRLLTEYAAWLKEHPRVWVTLIGFAGAGLTKEFAYNLGMARALAVMEYLEALGIDARQLYPISYGNELLFVAPDSGDDGLNHRVEIIGFAAPAGSVGPQPVPLGPEPAPAMQLPAESETLRSPNP